MQSQLYDQNRTQNQQENQETDSANSDSSCQLNHGHKDSMDCHFTAFQEQIQLKEHQSNNDPQNQTQINSLDNNPLPSHQSHYAQDQLENILDAYRYEMKYHKLAQQSQKLISQQQQSLVNQQSSYLINQPSIGQGQKQSSDEQPQNNVKSDSLSLLNLIQKSRRQQSSVVSISAELLVLNYLNKSIFPTIESYFSSFFNTSNSTNNSSSKQWLNQLFCKILFVSIDQFIFSCRSPVNGGQHIQKQHNLSDVLIQSFKTARNQSIQCLHKFMLIAILSFILIGGNLGSFISFSLTIVLLSVIFLGYQIVKLGFYWMVFFFVFNIQSGTDKSDRQNSTNQSIENSIASQSTHPFAKFIYALLQIGIRQSQDHGDKSEKVDGTNKFIVFQSFQLSLYPNYCDKVSSLVAHIVKRIEMSGLSTSNMKVGQNKIVGSDDRAKTKYHSIQQLASIVLELFNNYDKEVAKLVEEISQISELRLDWQKNQSISVVCKNFHPVVALKKLPKLFSEVQRALYNCFSKSIEQSISAKNSNLLKLYKNYHHYQQNVKGHLLRDLQVMGLINGQSFVIGSQNQSLSDTGFNAQLLSVNKHQKQSLLNLLYPAKLSKGESEQQVTFKNQLYEFYHAMFTLIKNKSYQINTIQALEQLINYVEESISIKLFLLNSKKSSLLASSFTLFKSSHSQIQSLNKMQQKEHDECILKDDPIHIVSVEEKQQISKYLTVDHKLDTPLIVYEQFSKRQDTRQTLDNLIERFVLNQSQSQEPISFPNNQQKSTNYYNRDSDSQSSSPPKHESSSDEQDNPLFNRPFQLNPFQQQTTKPAIFSQSPLPFTFNVQQEMSQFFQRKLPKSEQPINQYE